MERCGAYPVLAPCLSNDELGARPPISCVAQLRAALSHYHFHAWSADFRQGAGAVVRARRPHAVYAVGSTAAVALGVYQDLGLLIAGGLSLVLLFRLKPDGEAAQQRVPEAD